MKLSRRVVASALAAVPLSGCFRLARPLSTDEPLSPHARALWRAAWRGLDPERVLDCHVHIVGLGVGGTGCFINPQLTEPLSHPMKAVQFAIYRAAAGVTDLANGDVEYLETLVTRLRSQLLHGRALILAFDQCHSESGTPMPDSSEFYTPNDYVLSLAKKFPDLFRPCASIHPYRPDAVDELHRVADGGAVAVKWLPNAMRIDPSLPRCDAFYDAMVKRGLPLLTHAGEEKAVDAEDAQRFGNPLLLRRPLERGLKVIVAHCASLGRNPDLDQPGQPSTENFDLFTRLMDSPEWKKNLFGDVSAMVQANRAGRPLSTVLRRSDWHPRLINGSDYPLPAITVLVQTRILRNLGLITAQERDALNEHDAHNPLQFDFVLKRTLALHEDGQTHRLGDCVFTPPEGLFPPS